MGRKIVDKCGVSPRQIGRLDMIRQKFERVGRAHVSVWRRRGVGMGRPRRFCARCPVIDVTLLELAAPSRAPHDKAMQMGKSRPDEARLSKTDACTGRICNEERFRPSAMSPIRSSSMMADGPIRSAMFFRRPSRLTRRLTPPPREQRRNNVRRGKAGRSSTRTAPAAGMRKRDAAMTAPTPTSRTRRRATAILPREC